MDLSCIFCLLFPSLSPLHFRKMDVYASSVPAFFSLTQAFVISF